MVLPFCLSSFNNRSLVWLLTVNYFTSGTCGQSYKHFTLVNYDSGVVIWGIFQSGTTLES